LLIESKQGKCMSDLLDLFLFANPAGNVFALPDYSIL